MARSTLHTSPGGASMASGFDRVCAVPVPQPSRRRALQVFVGPTAAGVGAAPRPRLGQATPAQPLSYPAGWNLVGGSPGSTLSGAASPLYTLRPGERAYQAVPADSPLSPCWG